MWETCQETIIIICKSFWLHVCKSWFTCISSDHIRSEVAVSADGCKNKRHLAARWPLRSRLCMRTCPIKRSSFCLSGDPPLSGCISSQASEELQQCCNLGSLLRRAEPFDTAVLIKITLRVIKQKSRRRREEKGCGEHATAHRRCHRPVKRQIKTVLNMLNPECWNKGKCTSFSAAH